jgi:hypothetical protein
LPKPAIFEERPEGPSSVFLLPLKNVKTEA